MGEHTSHGRELMREMKLRDRAIVRGALVRPPKNAVELASDEAATAAEITSLQSRRSRLWRLLGSGTAISNRERDDAAYDVARATEALDTAYAVKRRLMLARTLMH